MHKQINTQKCIATMFFPSTLKSHWIRRDIAKLILSFSFHDYKQADHGYVFILSL